VNPRTALQQKRTALLERRHHAEAFGKAVGAIEAELAAIEIELDARMVLAIAAQTGAAPSTPIAQRFTPKARPRCASCRAELAVGDLVVHIAPGRRAVRRGQGRRSLLVHLADVTRTDQVLSAPIRLA